MSTLYLICQWFWKRRAGWHACECSFPYRSGICSMGLDRPSWNAIQWILYKRDGKRKDDLMEWQFEKERGLWRENAGNTDEKELCMVHFSHCVCSFFHCSISAVLQVQYLPVSSSPQCPFPARLHLLYVSQLITEAYVWGMLDWRAELWQADGLFPLSKCGCCRTNPSWCVEVWLLERELSALPAPWQVMDKEVHYIRASVRPLI